MHTWTRFNACFSPPRKNRSISIRKPTNQPNDTLPVPSIHTINHTCGSETYLSTLRDRPRHPPDDPHLPAQPLQPRQRAPAALDAADVVLGQGAHVDGPLAPVGFAAGPPVLRHGEAVEVVEGGGVRVGCEEGEEGGEVGLFGHLFLL